MRTLNNFSYADVLHRCFIFSLCAVVFFLPLRVHFSHIAIGAAAGLWLLNIKHYYKNFSRALLVPLLLFTSIYWILVIGLLYSENLKTAGSILEKKLSLLLLPVIIVLSSTTKKQLNIIGTTLIAGVLLASGYCYFHTFKSIASENLPWTSIFTDMRFQNLFFSRFVPIHPAYLSNLLILSLIFIIYWFRGSSTAVRFILISIALFFAVTVLILMARASILAVFVVPAGLIVYKTIQSRRIAILLGGIGLLLLTMGASIYLIPNIKDRFLESLSSFDEMVRNDDQYHSIPLHAKVWHCSMRSNKGLAIIFGQGTGDEKDVLRSCYAENNWDVILQWSLDSHNEYLSSYVRNGLIGVCLWIAAIVYGAYLAIRSRNSAYLSFIILMAVAAFSESILRGQVSLLTYAFFNAAFARYALLSIDREGDPLNVSSPDIKAA